MDRADTTVLILGGTGEARALAALLVDAGMPVVSSLAGRVRDPALPVGEVRIGGFGGAPGMARWLSEHRCDIVVDATHPFAQQISHNAVTATATTGARLISLRRPPWTSEADTPWTRVPDIGSAAVHLTSGEARRVFLTTGRQDVDAFAGNDISWFLIRVVDPPGGPLPAHHRVIRSRGPYLLEGERELMIDNRIDTLVTKNSGGELTRAKLEAAAELGVEVVMVDRPPVAGGSEMVESVEAAFAALSNRTT